ncbi:MAG: DUF1365 domain-containing protein [Brachymonas sp.]|nr:DUF1365 domain-containing protein [Brachymonas sp.]
MKATHLPMIGFGQVRHTRLRPARNAFAYPTYFLMLPMRSLEQSARITLPRNRFAPISFYDKDHGDGRGNSLQWIDELLRSEGIEDAKGEVWLHCYPRVLGFTFKPVSFWYCHDARGQLRAVVVEVNNTFGERHIYVLDQAKYGHEMTASKVFHVSPFCAVEGDYSFRFMTAFSDTAEPERTVARIDYKDGQGMLLQTSVSGHLQAFNAQAVRKAMFSYGAMTLAVIARIHWQAMRLWLKRVPFFSKPSPPAVWVTR